jgi:preprotein translocase subunit SecA
MKYRLEDMVHRDFAYGIVDEVDSILIDEARTPLIISGPSTDSSELYIAVDKVIPHFEPDDYEKDEKVRAVSMTEAGTNKVEQILRAAVQHGDILVSEPDGGIFDALNKGLDRVETEYMGWLGSDDLFTGQVKASDVIAALAGHDVFVTGLAMWLELSREPPWYVHVLLWGPLALVLTLGFMRIAKGLLIALEFRHEARQGKL